MEKLHKLRDPKFLLYFAVAQIAGVPFIISQAMVELAINRGQKLFKFER